MATSFPGSQDSFTNPTSGSSLSSPSHSQQHADANDAIEAVQGALLDGAPLHIDDANERVGIGTTSPDNKLHVQLDGTSKAPASVPATHMIIADAGDTNDAGVAVYSSTTGFGYMRFGDSDNPARGGFSYAHTGDELKIRTAGSDRVTIDSSGNVTMPYQPAFYAYLSGSNPTYGTGWTNLIHNATLFNVGGGYSTSTKRFTAPVAGRYLFIMTFNFYNYTSGTRLIVHMDKNGAGYSRIMDWSPNSATATDETQTASVIMDLAVGNYVYPSINSADSSWQMSAGSLYNSFQGYFLG